MGSFLLRSHVYLKNRKEVIVFFGTIIGIIYGIFEYNESKERERIKYTFSLLDERRRYFSDISSRVDKISKIGADFFNLCQVDGAQEPHCLEEISDRYKLVYGKNLFSFLHGNNDYGVISDEYSTKEAKNEAGTAIVELGSYYSDLAYCSTSGVCSNNYICDTMVVHMFNYYLNYKGYIVEYRDRWNVFFAPNLRDIFYTCSRTRPFIAKNIRHPREVYNMDPDPVSGPRRKIYLR